jgi:predicted branched-subunit amino acid permease
VVKILTFIGYVVWGLGGSIGALLALAKGQIAVGAAAAFVCIFMVVMTKVFKEATLMVADLCDAAVVTAEKLSSP